MKKIFKDVILPILIALVCMALVVGGLITCSAIVKKCDAVKTEIILKDVKKAEGSYRGESLQILEPVLEMKTEEINAPYQRIQEQKVTHFVWSAYQSFTISPMWQPTISTIPRSTRKSADYRWKSLISRWR